MISPQGAYRVASFNSTQAIGIKQSFEFGYLNRPSSVEGGLFN